MAADALDTSMDDSKPEQDRANLMQRALADIISLSMDNAQLMAKRQLETTLECAQAKGAYALLHLRDDQDSDIDPDSDSILQPAFVDAITDFRKVTKAIDQPRNNKNRNNFSSRRGRGGFNRHGRGGLSARGRSFGRFNDNSQSGNGRSGSNPNQQ